MRDATPQRAQAATSFLVELGNGDKFVFDVGTGSAGNLGCLNIPYDYLDKVFLSHLHSDHAGDLVALWVGGWVSQRHGPLHVWGPSGPTPDLGTKAFIDNLKEAWKWDYVSRLGHLPTLGGGLEAHEFDYRGENQAVYERNGVTIRSWPVIHCLDGPVSYALEWKGLKFVFGGDTFPNKWYPKYAKGADLANHECFPPPNMLMTYQHIRLYHMELATSTVRRFENGKRRAQAAQSRSCISGTSRSSWTGSTNAPSRRKGRTPVERRTRRANTCVPSFCGPGNRN